MIDPIRLGELALAAAIHADVDAVFIEPTRAKDDTYAFTFERARQVVATITVDADVATAAIARLGYIAGLDLASSSASSAFVPVQSGTQRGEVVITIRPGAGLRADLMVVPPVGQQRAVPPPKGEPGEVIGNYKILEMLGEGGMGTVYRVEHTALGRTYALKVLRAKEFQRDGSAAQRFLREARAASRVRHPHIVDVFDFGHVADGRPYFVMELLDGSTLYDLVRFDPLQPQDAVRVAQQLAQALAAAHDAGVIHADVTLSNAMVVERTPLHVKLVDFGLSAIAGEPAFENREGYVFGTPSYISPEQLCGMPATDRSDQYGLGCVLYALLVGRPPFQHPNTQELCRMHMHAPIPVVESPFGPLPPKLADIVTTCLQKSPHQRFPGMRALLAALDEISGRIDLTGWRRWLS